MEQEKKITQFKLPDKPKEILSNSDDFSLGNIPVNKTRKKPTIKKILRVNNIPSEQCEYIDIGRGVKVLVLKEEFSTNNLNRVMFNDITRVIFNDITRNYGILLEDILSIESDIAAFDPPLFEDFISEDNKIKPHVIAGNIVKVQRKYVAKHGDIPRRVEEIYFKSLSNMTVIIARLEDGDLCLTNTLELCK